jgi:hypothetical protein
MENQFFTRIVEGQGTIEDVMRKLPGFKGYLAKQDRRAADRLLREHIVRVFEELLREFTQLQNRMVDSGGLKYMEQARRIDTVLQTFIDRVRTAPEGYAGLFDAVKIREGELDKVYAFDNGLLVYSDQITTGLKRLEEAIGGDDIGGVLDQLDEAVREVAELFRRRAEAMKGLDQAV